MGINVVSDNSNVQTISFSIYRPNKIIAQNDKHILPFAVLIISNHL